MSRCLASMFLLTFAAPLPVFAGDSAALDRGQEAAPVIAAAAKGALRLIYLQEPPAIPESRPLATPHSAGQPPDRPVIVMAGTCNWDDREAGLGQIRSAFSASAVWLLEPSSPDCDPVAIKAAFDAASAAPERERLALLLANGLRLSEAEPSTPAAAAAPSGLFAGQLVISALPAGSSLEGSAPLLIQASSPDTLSAEPADTAQTGAATAQPAVRANASGRAGLPEPAVVVGELASLLAADKRGATGAPREVRDRIREIDPAFFNTLLEMGSFDPDEGQYVAAIQTELAGMNCYTGSVDGNWGPGSSSATGRYFSQVGAPQNTQAPGVALYREIATHPSVKCPAPVVTVRTNPTTPRRNESSSTRGSRTSRGDVNIGSGVRTGPGVRVGGQPVQPAATQPTVQATTGARINGDLARGPGGTGVIK